MTDWLKSLLRPHVRTACRLRDRSLHPIRRRRARRLLPAERAPSTILVMCTGNICRSPYAAKLLERRLGGNTHGPVAVISAGFLKPGRPPPETAVRTAGRRGVVLDDHRSRTVDSELLGAADLVVVMDAGHRTKIRELCDGSGPPILLLGDLDPRTPDRRGIPDPWGRPDMEFETCFERIDRCLDELASFVRPTRGLQE